MVQKSMTLDDLERLIRTLAENMPLTEPTRKKLDEDRPIFSAAECRPMTLFSRNVKYMRKFSGGSSGNGHQSTVGLSMTTFFGYFGGYFFENFREKASIVCSVQTKSDKKAVLRQGNRTMPL